MMLSVPKPLRCACTGAQISMPSHAAALESTARERDEVHPTRKTAVKSNVAHADPSDVNAQLIFSVASFEPRNSWHMGRVSGSPKP